MFSCAHSMFYNSLFCSDIAMKKIAWLATLVCSFWAVSADIEKQMAELKYLPHEHIPYYFLNNPQLKESCQQDDNCSYKVIN